LLIGLCQRFKLHDYEVKQIVHKDAQNDCDVFSITWK
jgi:hypothetical protein